ncbi:MAG: hypothetical protein Q9162_000355 [Coniocarpon cinnabarinum]
MSGKKQEGDLIPRGDKRPSPAGTATLLGLRGADPFLQYGILSGAGAATSLITTLGSSVLLQGPAASTGTFLDALNLSPYRLALLGMSGTSFLRHAYWKLFTCQEYFPASAAALVGAFNSVWNSINSLLFICSATSAAKYIGESPRSRDFPGAPLVVGSTVFAAGIAVEIISEIQRSNFKSKPENNGKPFTGGLWALSRHVNYLGYAMWRGGYALASAGWLWGAFTTGFFAFDFISRGIPANEEYCENRVSIFRETQSK